MESIIVVKGPYEMDVDKNGAVALTEKNVQFINGILKLDSSYCNSYDKEYIGSSANLISNSFYKGGEFNLSEDIVEEVVKALNKENSTHLFVADGVSKTTKTIHSITKFKERLSNGDPTLVQEISNATAERNNFSFASKFCSFVAKYAFENPKAADGFCIYDTVIANILPYYAWAYCGEKHIAKKNSSIKSEFKDKKDYEGYRNLIDNIIKSSAEKIDYRVSRADFDKIIWYCYKGNRKSIISNLLGMVGDPSRMFN